MKSIDIAKDIAYLCKKNGYEFKLVVWGCLCFIDVVKHIKICVYRRFNKYEFQCCG